MTARRMLNPAPERPDLQALIKRAIEEFEKLSPEEKRAHRRAQAISWVYGNINLDRDEAGDPEIPREEIERIYDERC